MRCAFVHVLCELIHIGEVFVESSDGYTLWILISLRLHGGVSLLFMQKGLGLYCHGKIVSSTLYRRLFSRVHVTLQSTLSVCGSVGRSRNAYGPMHSQLHPGERSSAEKKRKKIAPKKSCDRSGEARRGGRLIKK